MSRSRTIYQSEALFVGESVYASGKSKNKEVLRVQGANYGFKTNKQDINQYGRQLKLDAIDLRSPTVSFDFSYYLGDGLNEFNMGFNTDGDSQFISPFMTSFSGNNFYIVTSDEGQDAVDFNSGDSYSLIGIGNAHVTNYNLNMSVGSVPTVNVSYEASNIMSQNGFVSGQIITGVLPSIEPDNAESISGNVILNKPKDKGLFGPSIIKPGDITLEFPGFSNNNEGPISKVSQESFNIQNASLSLPLDRSEIYRLGSRYPYARVLDYPINATLTVSAVLNEIESENLINVISGCREQGNKDIRLNFKKCNKNPYGIDVGEAEESLKITLKGVDLISETFNSQVGSNKAVDVAFRVQVSSEEDRDQGLFFQTFNNCNIIATQEQTIAYNEFDSEIKSVFGDIPAGWMTNSGELNELSLGSGFSNIGASAFQGCTNLEGLLTVPDNVITISDLAFYGCTSLDAVEVGKFITDIGQSSFQGCTNLQFFTFCGSSNLKSVGSFAFKDTSLTEISFPNTIENFGEGVLSSSDGLSYADLGETLTIIPNSMFKDSPLLEEVVFTDSVEIIDRQAFDNNINLKEIYWSENLQEIRYRAFYNNQSLSEVIFYEGLSIIGQEAFELCSSLTNIVLPDSLGSIGEEAFKSCGVVNLELGENLSGLGFEAFELCTQLTFIDFGQTIDYIFPRSFKSCYSLPAIDLPDSITGIGYEAFSNCNSLETVEFGDGLIGIEYSAFYSCTSISGLNFPENLNFTSIGDSAFYNCNSIQNTIKLPDTLTEVLNQAFMLCSSFTSLEIGAGLNTISDYCFYGCSSLTGLNVPNTLDNINQYAFAYCGDLSGINFSENIQYIGNYAFSNCSDLSGVSFPESIEVVDSGAYRNCTSLKYIEFNTNVDYDDVSFSCFNNCTTLTGIDLTPNILSVGDYAFQQCFDLSGINFNETITGIGRYAFSNCTDLSGITYPQSLTFVDNYAYELCSSLLYIDFNTNTNFDKIETGVFSRCSALPLVSIPNNITTVGSRSFQYCYSLESVDFGDFTETIESYAFNSCTTFNNLVIPPTVTGILERAFTGCSLLETMNPFPEILTRIGAAAFAYCSLTGINDILTIPNSVTHIGKEAFERNYFTEVDLGDGIDYLRSETFRACPDLTGINLNLITGIDFSCFQNCVSLTGALIYPIIEDIGTYAFSNTALIDVRIPDSLDYINDGVFSFCPDFTGVISGNVLTGIGNYSFYECPSLTEYYPPNSLLGVGNYSFAGCTSMSGFNLNQIETIGTYAFWNCTSLPKLLTIEDTVQSIGTNAFNGCTSLTGIDWQVGVNIGASPNNVAGGVIPQGTFKSCSSLSGLLTIQQGVVYIGGEAFRFCNSLTGVAFPDGLDYIGGGIRDFINPSYRGAFEQCVNLSGTIALPGSLTHMGKYAFDGCDQIETFEFYSPTQPITRKDAFPTKFYNDPGNNPIHAPIGAEASYSGQSFVPSNLPLIYGPQRNPVNWSQLNIIFDIVI